MTSLLRQLVAGPRAPHAESKLDLCYVTNDIIVTSGPSSSYPTRAYRNPLPRLVDFITKRHAEEWRVFEFRAEGTGYGDDAVGGRIRHFPWPDHHPPPFGLVPQIMAAMREWLEEEVEEKKRKKTVQGNKVEEKDDEALRNDGGGNDGGGGIGGSSCEKMERVAILHCKAGKGRSGTVACSYLIAVRKWKAEDALKRFTDRRMRPGWGEGISIKSQRRWIDYVSRWTKDKKYTEIKVRVTEVRIWGMRDGCKISIRGFIDDGKIIKTFYKWDEQDGEKTTLSESQWEEQLSNASDDPLPGSISKNSSNDSGHHTPTKGTDTPSSGSGRSTPVFISPLPGSPSSLSPAPTTLTVFRPKEPLVLPTQDVNVAVERRSRNSYGIPSVVTSTAHSWFNAFFEGHGPEHDGVPEKSGVYEIVWEGMDGLKGSSRRGVRAMEKIAVSWEAVEDEPPVEVKETIPDDEQNKSDKLDTDAVDDTESGAESDAEGVQCYGV